MTVTAPKEVPGWAMSSGTEPDVVERRAVRRASRPQQTEEDRAAEAERLIPSDTTISTGNASLPSTGRKLLVRAQPHRMGAEKPSTAAPESAEVQARESAADEQLRRQMTICRGC